MAKGFNPRGVFNRRRREVNVIAKVDSYIAIEDKPISYIEFFFWACVGFFIAPPIYTILKTQGLI